MLETIIKTKKAELEFFKLPDRPHEPFKSRSLKEALTTDTNRVSLIAEVKRRSPSKGAFNLDVDPACQAGGYEYGGARAISVLTDESYFGGSVQDLIKVKAQAGIPVLRKDFIIDMRQIEESERIGADAILLIAEALSPAQLGEFADYAESLGLEYIVECHSLTELEKILGVMEPPILGINNRDLKTFHTTLDTVASLQKYIPSHTVTVSESGVRSREDMEYLKSVGVDAALVGEALMKAENPAAGVRALYE